MHLLKQQQVVINLIIEAIKPRLYQVNNANTGQSKMPLQLIHLPMILGQIHFQMVLMMTIIVEMVTGQSQILKYGAILNHMIQAKIFVHH